MRQIAQLLLMCDRHDIGVSIDSEPDPLSARVFIYDNYPGGIGFSDPLFRMHHELLAAARRLIAECECETGCPGCVGPVGNTGPLAKSAALRILDLLLTEPSGA
jgi:DEAD/DEAH box helicase domain-containing protein